MTKPVLLHMVQNNRSFTQTIWEGTKEANKETNGATILTMDRPLVCPLQPCCCCNFARRPTA
mgnify:CR=1 FL=1